MRTARKCTGSTLTPSGAPLPSLTARVQIPELERQQDNESATRKALGAEIKPSARKRWETTGHEQLFFPQQKIERGIGATRETLAAGDLGPSL